MNWRELSIRSGRVYYRQVITGDQELDLDDVMQLSPGEGYGADLARNPRVAVDESGRVHVAWYGVDSYRYCDGGSACNSGGWPPAKEPPAGSFSSDIDLATGRDAGGTAVVHLLDDTSYTRRIINCTTDCWLTPTIDVSPLVPFAQFKPGSAGHRGLTDAPRRWWVKLLQQAIYTTLT